jgi:hypothetical protein
MQEYWRIKNYATMVSIALVAYMLGVILPPMGAAIGGIVLGTRLARALNHDFEKQFRTHFDELFNPNPEQFRRLILNVGFCALSVAAVTVDLLGAVGASLTGWLAGMVALNKMLK